jgi:adenosylhomocysteine nucleosidase
MAGGNDALAGGDGARRRVGMLAPMPSELGPLVKAASLERTRIGSLHAHTGTVGTTAVVATKTGIGMQLAAAATERLLDAAAVELVIVVGIAGGVPHASKVGDVIVPERVVDGHTGEEFMPAPLVGWSPIGILESSDDFAVTDDDIAQLRTRGVVAVDMETAAVAAVCARRAVPWSVVRAISDMAGDTPHDVLGMANPDGSPNLAAGLKYMARHPQRVPALVKLARDSTRAAHAAARAAVEAIRHR